MNSGLCRRACSIIVGLTSAGAAGLLGCHQASNPWEDELAHLPQVTTVSVDAAHAATTEPSLRSRSHASIAVGPISGCVSHGPLYFMDPLERNANDDGVFAWTAEDYGEFLLATPRFLVNIALFPLNAAVSPPTVLLHSDGA